MAPRILIAGGYGIVGAAIARHIRQTSPEAELVLAGRTPETGAALADELGSARTARLDLGAAELDLPPVDLVVAALYDPANRLVDAALKQGIAHIGITTKAEDVAPIAFAALASPPKRPLVLLGHCAAGVATLVAARAAEAFARVGRIEMTAVFDILDPVGPMTASDAETLIARALLRREGAWAWVDGPEHPRTVRLADGRTLEAYPTGLLDVPSLAAITHAAEIRLDMAVGDSLGTRAGGQASSDVHIEIEGRLASGARARRRIVLSDPKGLAHLTGLGVAVAAERVLGLDGGARPAGGLYLPETLLSPDAAIARFEARGVRITTETDDASAAA